MFNLRRLAVLLSVMLPISLAPSCSDNTSTKGQLITCTRGTHNCQPTNSATPASADQCTDVDEDGDGEDHDAADEADDGADLVARPGDKDGDGEADDVDTDDDNDGIPDTDDCDEAPGGDDDPAGGGSGSGA